MYWLYKVLGIKPILHTNTLPTELYILSPDLHLVLDYKHSVHSFLLPTTLQIKKACLTQHRKDGFHVQVTHALGHPH